MIALLLALSIATLPAPGPAGPEPGRIVDGLTPEPILRADFTGNVRDGSARRAMTHAFAHLKQYVAAHHLAIAPARLPMASITHFDDETGVLTGAVAYVVGAPTPAPTETGISAGQTPSGRAARFETHAVFGKANSDYEDFGAWLSKHDLHPRSDAWEVYTAQGGDTDRVLTYVYYPLP